MTQLMPSDAAIVDLLREHGQMTISGFADQLQVTATAVRQRLSRLMENGLVTRESIPTEGRGRPGHQYLLTDQGRKVGGGNFADLAFAMWDELRSIREPMVRRGLLERIAERLATSYRSKLSGETIAAKMESVARLFGERQVPFAVDCSGELPVLKATCCPYPDLAERDRGVCAMERMMISKMIDEPLQLSGCRLDGGTCCTFELGS